MSLDEDENLPEESDSDDEDFEPGSEPKQELSEEDEEGDDEEKTDNKSSTKRKNGKVSKGRKRKKRKGESDEDDADFVMTDNFSNEEDEVEKPEDPEVVAAREKAEKERTDLLWADFLTSVETSKSKKTTSKEPQTKVVTKVYDFAGEKVEVKEKVKVTAEDSETRSSTSSSLSTAESSSSANDSKRLNGLNSLNGVGSSRNSFLVTSPEPETSTNGDGDRSRPQFPRKTRISFLSGDPADIGLTGDRRSAREGLASVLNALQARNKKIGTLEKSKLDWETYKQQEGLEEELEGHTKSKHGYIDKQEFLHRADLRQFEIEKEARSKRRRNP